MPVRALIFVCIAALPLMCSSSFALAAQSPHPYAAQPELERDLGASFALAGPFGDRMRANVNSWLLSAPSANPAMLQIFRDRDRMPPRDLVPWAGEFAGKYLISASQAVRLTGDRTLKESVAGFVRELIATQRADGYLGPFPAAEGMTGPGRWDLWGQYHVMLGLYEWYLATGDKQSLAACRRCADLFCRIFLDGHKRVVQAGSEEMNESSIHIFTLLYRQTGEPRYLQMAREIEKDWEQAPSGDYVRTSLAGMPYYKTPKPRWEGLHSVQAIAELYFLTGDPRYRQAYEQIWRSIQAGDRHNTGGFSSGEQATGNPYDPRAIETCCTVAWMAITRDMLRMTGDSRVADELEISTWNGIMGAQHPSGRWWTYNTPMDGDRKASAHEIVFQARPGSPELNCCSVNGPRGLGVLADWALMRSANGVSLNWYGSGAMTTHLPDGSKLTLVQQTDYPRSGAINLRVKPDRERRFKLRLRIPGWSGSTSLSVNGHAVEGVKAGTYCELERTWRPNDAVRIVLDMRPWFWAGEREAAGKVSLYHGPILMAYDPRFDRYEPGHLPVLAVGRGAVAVLKPDAESGTIMQMRISTADGGAITLCDFASAGAAGNRYVSWLPAPGVRPVPYSAGNPLRLQR